MNGWIPTIVEIAADYWVILWNNDGGNIWGSDAYPDLGSAVQRICNWYMGH